jgi:8-oxo-dGTP pyrophosphatase MutT (NUDIX family)
MICIAPTGRIFLMKRSAHVNNPFYWSIPAGRIDRDEMPLEAAVRELYEEAGYDRALQIVDHVVNRRKKRKFHYFVARVPVQFRAKLNWENEAAGWFYLDELPEPLHPGMLGMLERL